METADLSTSRFWEGDENHIAVNPQRASDADGLAGFAQTKLAARGWCFFQTSGSEGSPKWVGLTKEAFLISARAVNTFFDTTPADRWLVALPLHHVGGFAIHARCFVSGAGHATMSGKWEARAFAEACADGSITLASLVPTQLFDLVRDRITAPSSVRAVIVGGGSLSPDLRTRALEFGWPVCASYGMTEAASQIATQSTDGYAHAAPEAMEVLPHWETISGADEVLVIRGPALAKGFAVRDGRGAWSWQAIDESAGLRTRDRVRLWQHGTRRYLQFIGRESAFIKICGELVNRDALQQRLDALAREMNFTEKAVLVPVPDSRRETVLIMVFERGKSVPEARAKLVESYNSASRPFERVLTARELEEMPVSDLGKHPVADLAAKLTSVAAARPG